MQIHKANINDLKKLRDLNIITAGDFTIPCSGMNRSPRQKNQQRNIRVKLHLIQQLKNTFFSTYGILSRGYHMIGHKTILNNLLNEACVSVYIVPSTVCVCVCVLERKT